MCFILGLLKMINAKTDHNLCFDILFWLHNFCGLFAMLIYCILSLIFLTCLSRKDSHIFCRCKDIFSSVTLWELFCLTMCYFICWYIFSFSKMQGVNMLIYFFCDIYIHMICVRVYVELEVTMYMLVCCCKFCWSLLQTTVKQTLLCSVSNTSYILKAGAWIKVTHHWIYDKKLKYLIWYI